MFMHYLTSNFNLMDTNSNWDKLKKNNIILDKNYNGTIVSLNKKNLDNYNFFHSIFYIDIFNFNQTIKELKMLSQVVKENKDKIFFLYIFKNFNENPIQRKLFDDNFLKIKLDLENIYIKTFDQFTEKFFSERNKIYIRFPFEINFINFISNQIKKILSFLQVSHIN